MALSLALTRCAITLFFIHMLFTQTFPWLRQTGIYSYQDCASSYLRPPLTYAYSIRLHLLYNRFMPRLHSRHPAPLSPNLPQLDSTIQKPPVLLQSRTLCCFRSGYWGRTGFYHLGATTHGRMETAAA